MKMIFKNNTKKSCFFVLSYLMGSILLTSCATIYEEEWAVPVPEGNMSNNNLFVFFDGTANNPASRTNIWRLYQIIKEDNKKSTKAKYIEGVGTRDKPASGMALGRGMEKRILMGYKYLTENYQPGDKIYIFGFSRGAHQARSLAGLVSYSGLPILRNQEDRDMMKIGNKIIEITKEKNDRDYLKSWMEWSPNTEPLLKKEIKDKLDLETQSVEIAFLGVWDTVPGSWFKEFGECKEKEDSKDGDRYKSNSYPVLKQIVQALSIDEKRSKFYPLRICDAINPAFTTVNEMWFPGAHADVGGGYEDYNGLSGISLNWMLKNLSETYVFSKPLPKVKENYKDVAHWSIGDRPANIGSHCVNREIPRSAKIHKAYDKRKAAGLVPVRIEGIVHKKEYPILCP